MDGSLDRFFALHPVFTHKEFSVFMRERGQLDPHYQNMALYYHIKRGHLVRVRRKLYAVVPKTASSESFIADMYLIAAKMANDAVLSQHTALELHGFGYSIFEHYFYFSQVKLSEFEYKNHLFRRIKPSQKLITLGKQNTETVVVNRLGIDIRITSLERTIVDMLDRPELNGGWEEVWRSIESIISFDVHKLIHYTLLINKSTLTAKVGFYLEQLSKMVEIKEDQLKRLQKHIPKKAHYLERVKRRSGKYIKRWNLIVPSEILNKEWEEPNEDI